MIWRFGSTIMISIGVIVSEKRRRSGSDGNGVVARWEVVKRRRSVVDELGEPF